MAPSTSDLFAQALDLYERSMRIKVSGSAGLSGRHRVALGLDRERYAIEGELARRGFKFDPEDKCGECGRHAMAPCGNCGREAA